MGSGTRDALAPGPVAGSSTSSRANDAIEGSFLLALAGRVELRLVVLSSLTRRPRHVWIADVGDEADIAQLDRIGQQWLQERRSTEGRAAVSRTLEAVPESIAFAAVPGPRGDVAAVLLAVKSEGHSWTIEERRLLRFAAEHYADPLRSWSRRPQPRNAPGAPAVRGAYGQDGRAPLEGELALAYQPEIDLITGQVLAVEALVRWNHPQRGEVGPSEFVSAAEQSGLIRALGAWVIDHSIHDLAEWLTHFELPDLVLRVNVSPAQLDGDDLAARFRTALAGCGVDGTHVCVEITENMSVSDPDRLVATMQELKTLGVLTAIDDLATGYSTLAQLRTLPVDAVKIDRTLVSGLDVDERARAIVAAVIRLGDDLGLSVVAEGVETAAEAETLVALGCRRGQGHYLGRPMPAAEIAQMFARAHAS